MMSEAVGILEALPKISKEHQETLIKTFDATISSLFDAMAELAEEGWEWEMYYDSERGYLLVIVRPPKEGEP